jgi:acyl-CoA thioesterase
MSDFQPVRVEMKLESGGRAETYPDLDPPVRDGIIKFFNDPPTTTFNRTLGMRLIDVKRGYSRLELDSRVEVSQPAGVMHGGASFGLADAAVAMALLGIYGVGNILLTIEMKINYLEAIPVGSLAVAEAYVLRSSKRSAYAEVDIWADGKLAARANTTYMIRPRNPAG